MIQSLLIILWMVFGTMTVSALLYKNHQENQLLGVTMSSKHEKTNEVKQIIKRFKTECYTILILSVGFSLLILVEEIKLYAEFYMLFLIIVNIFVNWHMIHRYQKMLQDIKIKNNWVYPTSKVVKVDLNASKEKGKSKVSVVWTWMFFLLSFIPTLILLLNQELRIFYPIGFSFIGPLCQLSGIYLYYQMIGHHSPVKSDDTELNKVCARRQERINSIAATYSSLVMLVFWILFSISIIYLENIILLMLLPALLVAGLLMIAHWQQKRNRDIENSLFSDVGEGEEEIFEQKDVWRWGLYYNPADPRFLVPKRMGSMGWTFNVGNPKGKAISIGILVLLLGIIGTTFYGSMKDYLITENGSEITIDASMYDISFEKEDVVSVDIINNIPEGRRVNGYGGIKKSFGHFAFEGYGKSMFYSYNDIDKYVVLELKGKNPHFVIINEKSLEQTEELYQKIKQWIRE